MAYQPKSYRKFIATAATATIVASAVAPAASAASVSDFKDVAAKYQDAVNYLVVNGITQGTSDTTFGTHDNVKRGDAAIWLAKALKLDLTNVPASGFSDTGRYDAAVSALKAKGILSGKTETTYAPNALLTRGEMAKILANAYQLESDAAVPFTDLGPNFGPYIKALYEYEVTQGKTETTFGTSQNITRGDLAIFLKRAAEVVKTPEVTSVTAVNLKQIEVKFNTKLDKTTAENETKYLLNNAALADGTTASQSPKQAKAELQADGKTVVVTLADTLTNNAAVTFKVDGVKDAKGTEIESAAFAVTVSDKVDPTVTSVEYTADGNVVFNFSEYLNQSVALSNVTVRVNGNPVTSGNLSYGSDGKSVEATVSLTKGSTNSVYAAGFKDLANNEMGLFTGSVVATDDNTLPTIQSVTQVGQNTVRFVFSEPLSSSGANQFAANDITVLKGTSTYTNGAGSTEIGVSKNTSVDSSGKTYDVTIDLAGAGKPNYGIYDAGSTSQSLTLLVAAQSFADVYGNQNSGVYSQTITMSKDTAAPKLVSSKVSDDKQTFEFLFDEVIGSTPVSNVTVVNSEGVLQSVNSVSRKGATGDAAKTLVVDLLSATTAMNAGTYTITVGAGTVEDELGNEISTFTQTLTVGSGSDTTKPTASVSTTAKNVFTVTYSEEVTGSALNASSYTLDGAALPSGTSLVFTDSNKDTVRITLPANSINIGSQASGVNGVLTVKNVADKAGNVIATANHNVTLKDNTAATLTGARLLGNTLELTFDEKLDSTFTVSDLSDLLDEVEIKGGSTTLTDGSTDVVSATVSGSKVTFTITGGNSNWDTVKAASSITVETDSPTLTDANGVVVKDDVKVSVSK